jgi:hypothetical protein
MLFSVCLHSYYTNRYLFFLALSYYLYILSSASFPTAFLLSFLIFPCSSLSFVMTPLSHLFPVFLGTFNLCFYSVSFDTYIYLPHFPLLYDFISVYKMESAQPIKFPTWVCKMVGLNLCRERDYYDCAPDFLSPCIIVREISLNYFVFFQN